VKRDTEILVTACQLIVLALGEQLIYHKVHNVNAGKTHNHKGRIQIWNR